MAALFISTIHNPPSIGRCNSFVRAHTHTHVHTPSPELREGRSTSHKEKMRRHPILKPSASPCTWYIGWDSQIIWPQPSWAAPVSCNSPPNLRLVGRAVPWPRGVHHGPKAFTQNPLAVPHTTRGSLTSHKIKKWIRDIQREGKTRKGSWSHEASVCRVAAQGTRQAELEGRRAPPCRSWGSRCTASAGLAPRCMTLRSWSGIERWVSGTVHCQEKKRHFEP